MYVCMYVHLLSIHTRTHTHPGTWQCGLQSETLCPNNNKNGKKSKPGLHVCLPGLAEDRETQCGQCVREALGKDVPFLGRRDETRKAVLSTRPGNQNLETKTVTFGECQLFQLNLYWSVLSLTEVKALASPVTSSCSTLKDLQSPGAPEESLGRENLRYTGVN